MLILSVKSFPLWFHIPPVITCLVHELQTVNARVSLILDVTCNSSRLFTTGPVIKLDVIGNDKFRHPTLIQQIMLGHTYFDRKLTASGQALHNTSLARATQQSKDHPTS